MENEPTRNRENEHYGCSVVTARGEPSQALFPLVEATNATILMFAAVTGTPLSEDAQPNSDVEFPIREQKLTYQLYIRNENRKTAAR